VVEFFGSKWIFAFVESLN